MIICKPHEIISIITPYLPIDPIIVEAGAFDGADTLRLAKHWPVGQVHAFEPVPQLFNTLRENTRAQSNVHCYSTALSDHTGQAPFYIAEKPHKPGIPVQAGSLYPPKERLHYSPIQFPYTITVETVTLDAWATQYSIDNVDFLWLDLQGHELAALYGASTILKTVRVIHTEVSFIESYAGQPQYEQVKAWLADYNFVEIARTFDNQEDWFFGNIVCIQYA